MKKYLTQTLLVIIVILSILMLCIGYTSIRDKEKSNNDLKLQKECAHESANYFKEYAGNTSSYSNHYNKKLNRCFIIINTGIGIGEEYITGISLTDVLENRHFAAYANKTKIGPGSCYVYKVDNSKTDCKSREEFMELIKNYMEE